MYIDYVNMKVLNRASINYAMAREAILQDAKVIAVSNAARSKSWTKEKKEFVIHFLKGKIIESKQGKFVSFEDGSKAKF